MRPLVDRFCLQLVARQTLTKDHFSQSAAGCLLGKAGRAHYYNACEEYTDPLRRSISHSVQDLLQAIALATPPGGIHWSGLPETWQDDPALLPGDESGGGNINENGNPAGPGAADAISSLDGTDEPGAPSAPSNRKPWTLI